MANQRTLGGETANRGSLKAAFLTPRNIASAVVVLIGIVLIIAWAIPGLLLTLLLEGIVFVATMRTHRGSPLQRWRAGTRWRERKRLGTTSFRPVELRPAHLSSGAKLTKQQVREYNAYRDEPDAVEGFFWLQRGPGRPGIAWNYPTGQDAWLSVVFSLEGQIKGLEGDDFLDAASEAWGAALARYGSAHLLPARVQVLTRVLPVDPAWHMEWADANARRDLPQVLFDSYAEVVALTASRGLMQRHFAVVRWPLGPEFMQEAQRHGPLQEGWLRLMALEIDDVLSHLRGAQLGAVDVLSAAQVSAVFKHMQHPDWMIDHVSDPDPTDSAWFASDDFRSCTVVKGNGPDGPDGEPGQYAEWWHRTALFPIEAVSTQPRDAMWLTPMLSQLTWPLIRTVSLQIEMSPASAARAAASGDVTADLAELERQRRKGQISTGEYETRLNAARSRLVDVNPGSGHHGAGWAGHVTISARTFEELQAGSRKIAEAANNAGIEWLEWQDTFQAAAMGATWPVCRGMAPVDPAPGGMIARLAAGKPTKEEMAL